MCTTCGCGMGEVLIDGEVGIAGGEAARPRGRLHVNADGRVEVASEISQGESARGAFERNGPAASPGPRGSREPAPAVVAGIPRPPAATRTIRVQQDILAKNDAFAQANRRLLAARGVFSINLVSSPGAGKTTLLVKTIEAIAGRIPIAVIEGDQQTSRDADCIRATGVPAVQINTGRGCHLDAPSVGRAIERLDPAEGSLLVIENVGNLVCPAAFDLGEAHKVVILSVTEGEDKPLKYANVFRASDLMLLAKTDLLPYLSFDVERCVDYARRVNPAIEVLPVSSTSGEGLGAWVDWLCRGVSRACTDGARRAR